MEHLHEKLRDSLEALVTSEDWRKALEVAARFHDYSFANTQLIWHQAMTRGFQPSRVAGYRTWQKLGRQVRRGERGIQILAPVTRTVETDDGEEERRVVGYRVVHVFDQSQTDGQPLPEIRASLLEGDLPAQWDKVAELVNSAGFSLEVSDLDRLGEANGITDWRDHRVVVRSGLPGAQRFKTLVHELAHIQLHEPTSGRRPNCRGIIEVEAESVTYIVCAALGVDSTGYSLPYVASWSGGDIDKVAATAERAIRSARQILTRLELEQTLSQERSYPEIVNTRRRVPTAAEQRMPKQAQAVLLIDRHPELSEALGSAVAFYRERLAHRDGSDARTFLNDRGFYDDTVDRWQLGYAPAAWDSLAKHLRSMGVSDQVLLEAGLASRARTGRLYDHLRGRVVFPVFDAQGSPRGFAGRLIAGDGPKYLNSPETPLYKKSALLYGLHHAKEAIAHAGQAIVVEGYTDAIATHQAGLIKTVATGGTALTSKQMEALRSLASNLTLAFDGDQAGLQAAERVADLSGPTLQGLHLQLAQLPVGTDPAGLIADGRADILQAALSNPTPLLHHLIDRTLDRYDLNEVEATVRALYAASPLIEHLTDHSGRRTVLSYLARRLDREEDHIEQALRDYSHTRHRELELDRGRTLT